MLYIFDLGNVILNVDFKRVLGVWSHLSGVPLATLAENFVMGDTFEQHERAEISDEVFAQKMCEEMGIALSFEQFALGWQAIFNGVRPGMLELLHQLRQQGHRVVILSNTNNLHCLHWSKHHPEIIQAVDKVYLSQQMHMRKPEARIYQHVLKCENTSPTDAVFFDDNESNVIAAQAVGITAILVTDENTIPAFFSQKTV